MMDSYKTKVTLLVSAVSAALVGLLIYLKSQRAMDRPPKDEPKGSDKKKQHSSASTSNCVKDAATDTTPKILEGEPCIRETKSHLQTVSKASATNCAPELMSNSEEKHPAPCEQAVQSLQSMNGASECTEPAAPQKTIVRSLESSPLHAVSKTAENSERSSESVPEKSGTNQCDLQPGEISKEIIDEETIVSVSASPSSSRLPQQYKNEEKPTTNDSDVQVVEEIMTEVTTRTSYSECSAPPMENGTGSSRVGDKNPETAIVPHSADSIEDHTGTSAHNHSGTNAPDTSVTDKTPDQSISSISLPSNSVIETSHTEPHEMSLSQVNDALDQLDFTTPAKSSECGDTQELETPSTSMDECNKVIDEFTASIELHEEEQDTVLSSAILAESLNESDTTTPSVTDSGISVSTTTSTTTNQLLSTTSNNTTSNHTTSHRASTHLTIQSVNETHPTSTPHILHRPNDLTTLNGGRVSPTHTDNTDSTGSAPDLSSDILSNGSRGSMSNISPPGCELRDGHIQHIFLMPLDVVGSFIGRFGKNILALKSQTHTDIRVKNDHVVQGYKVCVVQGKHEHVEKALRLIRRQYPKVNTTPMDHILRVAAQAKLQQQLTSISPVIPPQSRLLSLPYNIAMEVYVCNIQTAGHIFVQMCSHPSYIPYTQLQKTFNSIYGDGTDVPSIPDSCEPGVLCAAHLDDTWARAHVLQFDESRENCEVKLLDLGGYYNLPVSSLRQMRQDFISHPFQAIEIYIDEIVPLEEGMYTEEAYQAVSDLTYNQALSCVATSPALNAPNVPYCRITVLDHKQPFSLAERLIEMGVVSRYDPTIQPTTDPQYSEELS